MAKKKSLDDFDMDMDFDDMDLDLDMDMDMDMKSRDPISAIKNNLKNRASKEGVKNISKGILKNSIPSSYTAAFDATYNVRRDAERIYAKTLKEAAPGISALRSKAKGNIDKIEKYTPKILAKRIRNFAEKEEYSSGNKIDPIEEEIKNSLSGIFGSLGKDSDGNLKEKIQEKRSRQKEFLITSNYQRSIVEGIARIVGYQDNVLYKYHQKSLELQYRQLFATRDLIQLHKTSQEGVLGELKAITKNTSLPDIVKAKTTETFHNLSQQKIIGSVQDSITKRLGNLPSKLSKGFESKASEFANILNEAMSAGDMTSGMDDMMSQYDMTAELGLGSLEEKATSAIGKRFKGLLQRNPFVAVMGNKALRYQRNSLRRINSGLKSGENDGWLSDLIKSFVGSEELSKDTINKNLMNDATDAVQWDMLSRRTLIEVIPGFLSRQLQQLTMIATGKSADRIVYDAKSEKFTTLKEKVKSTQLELNSKVSKELKTQKDKFIKEIDPEGKLSPQAQDALFNKVLSESRNGNEFKIENYLDQGFLDSAHSPEIEEFMRERFNIEQGDIDWNNGGTRKEYINKRRDIDTDNLIGELTDQFNELDKYIGSFDDVLNNLYKLGLTEVSDLSGVTRQVKGKREVDASYKKNLIQSILSGSDIINPNINEETFNIRDLSNLNGNQNTLNPDELTNTIKDQTEVFKESMTDIISVIGGSKPGSNIFKSRKTLKNINSFNDTLKTQTDETNNLLNQILEILKTKDFNGSSDFNLSENINDVSNKTKDFYTRQKRKANILSIKVKRKSNKLLNDLNNSEAKLWSDAILGGSKEFLKRNAKQNPYLEEYIDSNGKTKFRLNTLKVKEDFDESTANIIIKESASWISAIGNGTKEFTKRNAKEAQETIENSINNKKDFVNSIKNTKVGDFRKGITESYIDENGNTRYRVNRNNISNNELANKVTGYKVKTKSSNLYNKARKKANIGINGIRDLYVRGKALEPSIYADKLLNGEYFDKLTGKRIFSWNEINGELTNHNGETIVTYDDFLQGFVDHKNKQVINPFKKVYARLSSRFGIKFNKNNAVVKEDINQEKNRINFSLENKGERLNNLKRIGSEIKEAAKEIGKDIYSKDDPSKPKLYKRLIKEGSYIDQLTGKVIKTYMDITGPVINKEDESVVLSIEDIQEGLVDENNEPVPGIISRLKGLVQSGKDIKLSAIFKNGKFQLPEDGKSSSKWYMNIAGKLYHSLIAIPDVYKKEDLVNMTPTILGRDVPKGKYRDSKSGEIIYSIKDINGPIEDASTGEMLITADDYKKGLYDKHGNKLDSLFGKAYRFLAPIWGAQISAMKFIAKTAWKIVKSPIAIYKALTKTKCDVYVKGQLDSPKLHRLKMERGHYTDATTGKIITSIEDIKGPIKDMSSNGDLVLTQEDIQQGLVDGMGRKLKVGFFGKIGRVITGTLGTVFDITKGVTKFTLGAGKLVLKGIGKLAGGIGKLGFGIIKGSAKLMGGAALALLKMPFKISTSILKGMGITGNNPNDTTNIIQLENIRSQKENTVLLVNAINQLNPNNQMNYWEKAKSLREKLIGGKGNKEGKEKGKGIIGAIKNVASGVGNLLEGLLGNKAVLAALGIAGAGIAGWQTGKAIWNNIGDGAQEAVSNIFGTTVDKWKAKFGDKEAQGRLDASSNSTNSEGISYGDANPNMPATKMSKGSSDRMVMVYNAFKKARFSDKQARALTAEVGRENSYGDKMFGIHGDAANGATNLGFFSWQKERKTRLINFMRSKGLMKNDNTMIPGQASLDAMAEFTRSELEGPYKKGVSEFLNNPDIPANTAAQILGKKYIGWAYGQNRLSNGTSFDWKSHDARRAGYYSKLNELLGPGDKTSNTNNAQVSNTSYPNISSTSNLSSKSASDNVDYNPVKITNTKDGLLTAGKILPFSKNKDNSNSNLNAGNQSFIAGNSSINSALVSGTQDAISRGVKYNYGSKSSKSGSIDCSGWIMENNINACNASGDKSASRILGIMKQGAAQEGAAGIIRMVGQATGKELSGSDINLSNLKEGTLIGIDHSQGGAKSGAGRYKGIDHIVQVVKDPNTGKLLISESSSHKGVHFTDAGAWLSRMQKKPMYAVNPYGGLTGGFNNDSKLLITAADSSPVPKTGNDGSAIAKEKPVNEVAPKAAPISENKSNTKPLASAVSNPNQQSTSKEPGLTGKAEGGISNTDKIFIDQGNTANNTLNQILMSINNLGNILTKNGVNPNTGNVNSNQIDTNKSTPSNVSNIKVNPEVANQNQKKTAVNSVIDTSRQRAAGM